MLAGIKWIFFDLGSTLIDETAADTRRIMEMISGTEITEEAYREKRFEMIAAFAELGMAKPDPAIFEWALKQADCSPQNAVMVGDRMDKQMYQSLKSS